jgi:hypothetical protein
MSDLWNNPLSLTEDDEVVVKDASALLTPLHHTLALRLDVAKSRYSLEIIYTEPLNH